MWKLLNCLARKGKLNPMTNCTTDILVPRSKWQESYCSFLKPHRNNYNRVTLTAIITTLTTATTIVYLHLINMVFLSNIFYTCIYTFKGCLRIVSLDRPQCIWYSNTFRNSQKCSKTSKNVQKCSLSFGWSLAFFSIFGNLWQSWEGFGWLLEVFQNVWVLGNIQSPSGIFEKLWVTFIHFQNTTDYCWYLWVSL